MKLYKNLYLSEDLLEKKDKVILQLKERKYYKNRYLLVLIEDGPNQIEFYSTMLLYQKTISEPKGLVIGLASSYEEAILLVESITKEVLAETGDVDIRAYFQDKESDRI